MFAIKAFLDSLPCAKPTTSLQPKPTAEPKTAASAKSYRR
jgi:hypothetical protein